VSQKFVRYVRGSNEVGVNAFALSNNDVVVDAATGLEWMRYDSAFYSAGPFNEGTMDWTEALEYCETLDLAGRSDWKLPDAHELHSIVDYSRSPEATNSAAIDSIFQASSITNEAGQPDYGWYWTSTTHRDGRQPGENAVYIAFGRATGNFTTPRDLPQVLDVHGAGAQRSDPKIGPNRDPYGRGPQGDMIRIFNFVRCVRGASSSSPDAPQSCRVEPLETPSPTQMSSAPARLRMEAIVTITLGGIISTL
jgi:hypothetical protein